MESLENLEELETNTQPESENVSRQKWCRTRIFFERSNPDNDDKTDRLVGQQIRMMIHQLRKSCQEWLLCYAPVSQSAGLTGSESAELEVLKRWCDWDDRRRNHDKVRHWWTGAFPCARANTIDKFQMYIKRHMIHSSNWKIFVSHKEQRVSLMTAKYCISQALNYHSMSSGHVW